MEFLVGFFTFAFSWRRGVGVLTCPKLCVICVGEKGEMMLEMRSKVGDGANRK